jgi:deoxyribonucleoside regulator
MKTKFDIALMVKVAQMYYIDGMKQEEIAKHVKISRSLISMILTEAKDVGIVEVNIRNPLSNNDDISLQFEEKFNLRKCIVVPTSVQDTNVLRKLVAQRTVDLVNEMLENHSTIGLAWGRACYEFVSHYRTDKVLTGIDIIPLIGGSNQNAPYFQLNEMVRLFAEKTNGTPYFIHAPAITASTEEKNMFIQSSSMKGILEKWQGIDIVISGIGTLPNVNSSDRETYIGEYEIFKQLESNSAVGDICARYFNINGEFIKDEYYDRVIGIPVRDLKNSGKVICVASGKEKVNSIIGALRTSIIDTLVTDEQTGKSVLKACKK